MSRFPFCMLGHILKQLAAPSWPNISFALFYLRKLFLAKRAVSLTLFPILSCGAELRFLHVEVRSGLDPEKTVTQIRLPERRLQLLLCSEAGARRRVIDAINQSGRGHKSKPPVIELQDKVFFVTVPHNWQCSASRLLRDCESARSPHLSLSSVSQQQTRIHGALPQPPAASPPRKPDSNMTLGDNPAL
ncbi:hypothetical protein CCH79_00009150 [Gambusia affinis]|uniref:Uncharacterized protein n=1 Tax=Gambusia affinis TaxID=33528 RepID=A0A315W448_GAMAF|nr:hypothetical protein CCH79_00009150 [Gambusia affinis]